MYSVYFRIHQPWVSSTIFKKAPGQNSDVREILRNLVGFLEDWELEKIYHGKSKPWICSRPFYFFCDI